MATTNIILTEVRIAAEKGRTLKEGIAVDKKGHQTVDPKEALQGALTTFGGHKGSGLSIAISLLAGALLRIGSSNSATTERGMLMIAFRPELFGIRDRMEDDIQSSLKIFRERGNAKFRLPGERSSARMSRAHRSGIQVPNRYLDLFS